ncbi:extracellular matrix protein 1 [Aulostomus maculatus]
MSHVDGLLPSLLSSLCLIKHGCKVSLTDRSSTTASAGPITGPVCALPRFQALPGRPPPTLPPPPPLLPLSSLCQVTQLQDRRYNTDTIRSAMGSSWALVCATAFLWILLSSADKDEHILEQREVTFDLDTIMQEMQQPDSFMGQKEADLTDLFDMSEFSVMQVDTLKERGSSRPGVLTPRGRRPSFGPRSSPPILDYPVQFPLARPTPDNLQAICLHGDQRPLYPDSYFPDSGFGQLKRRASAVNKAESWFRSCCKGNQTWGEEVMLCCATQAWELSVESFCVEDSSVKDRLYHCCRLTGSTRQNCFNDDAPNPGYNPMEELPVPPLPSTDIFNFDPNTCRSSEVTPHSVRGHSEETSKRTDIKFPLGRPTVENIESLCQDQNLRPLYFIKCLPTTGYEMLARQAKTVNRMEKKFKQCCKKKQGVLNCAEQKWRAELNKFCSNRKSGKVDFECCWRVDDRSDCFQKMSPDPYYNMTSAPEEPSLRGICDTHKIIKKKFPVGFKIKGIVKKCCPLSSQDQNICFDQRLQDTLDEMCKFENILPPAVLSCCKMTPKGSPQCLSNILLDAISKATVSLRQKKRCPLSSIPQGL